MVFGFGFSATKTKPRKSIAWIQSCYLRKNKAFGSGLIENECNLILFPPLSILKFIYLFV